MTNEERKLSRVLKAQSDFEAEIAEDFEDLISRVSDLEKKTPDTHELLKTIRGPVGPVGPRGPVGPQGLEGKEGKEGKPGKNGKDGKDGKDGEDGQPGLDGKPGKPGKAGKDGAPGRPPKHEWFGTKLRFENPDGTWGKWVDLGTGLSGQMFGAVFDASSINQETPQGAIDGVNTTYTTNKPIIKVLQFAINGMVIHPGEFSFSGNRLTFSTPLPASLNDTAFTITYV